MDSLKKTIMAKTSENIVDLTMHLKKGHRAHNSCDANKSSICGSSIKEQDL